MKSPKISAPFKFDALKERAKRDLDDAGICRNCGEDFLTEDNDD